MKSASRRRTSKGEAMDWTGFLVLGDVARANARTYGDKAAFRTADGITTVSFALFNARVNRLNAALAGLGVQKGARVAILSRNRHEYVEALGVAKTGLIGVPLNWRLSVGEIRALLLLSRPQVVIVEACFVAVVEALRAELPFVRLFAVIGSAGDGWTDYEVLLARGVDTEPAASALPDDVLCLMHTSGTTGAPKEAALTHRGVLANCRTAVDQLLGLTPDDRSLAVMPFFHVGGFWYHLFPGFAAGCTTTILPEFDAAAVLRILAEQSITVVHLVPTMIAALVERPEACQLDLACLRRIHYAASPIPVELLKRALATFSRSGFVQGYGSTEAGMITALFPEDHAAALADPTKAPLLLSCGRPLPGVEVSVSSLDGRPAAADEVGEIAVRGARTMVGYWQDPEATARILADGWLSTGDVGFKDAAGYITLVARRGDMIITGGENVYPREVEEVLHRDPCILEAVVFGIPDPRWVERVVAAVVPRPGSAAVAEDIIGRTRAQLAGYKCPKTVFVLDSLPKNATGKVLKTELRRRFAQGDRDISA